MDKLKLGIPKSVFYFEHGYLLETFFKKLGCDVIISPDTNKEIEELGISYSNDEMCLSLKNYIGHVAYLSKICDYIIIPRIDNYGLNEQCCTNFLAMYDIVNNLFNIKILNYNIDYMHRKTEYKGFIKIARELGYQRDEIKSAYEYSKVQDSKRLKKIYIDELNKLNVVNKKILLVGHSYILNDYLIGEKIANFIKKNNIEVIKSCNLPSVSTSILSKRICKYLYWKESKEKVGSIEFCKDKVDGIIIVTAFPCGLDSIVNDLILKNVNKNIVTIVVDSSNISEGIITRIESLIDIIS